MQDPDEDASGRTGLEEDEDGQLPMSRLTLRVQWPRVTKMTSLMRVAHKMPVASLFQATPAQGTFKG